MTRIWRWPDLRNSAGTLHQVTDTHFGSGSHFPGRSTAAPWVAAWLARMQSDVEALRITTTGGHLHTGDMIDNWWEYDITPGQFQDIVDQQWVDYLSWRDGIQTTDGLPFAQAIGNHDSFGTIRAEGNSARVGTSGAQWAEIVGLPSVNNVWDMGQFRVICLGPDQWTDSVLLDFRLPDATIDWLDAQLSADSRPTFLAAHVPLLAQYPDFTQSADAANPRLHDVIGAHPNVVGWLSGHRHNSINPNQTNPVATVTVSGREIFAVCAPGGGGGVTTGGQAWSKGPWVASCYSTYLTLLDENTLDVRWRDHLSRRWVQYDPADARIQLTRSNN